MGMVALEVKMAGEFPKHHGEGEGEKDSPEKKEGGVEVADFTAGEGNQLAKAEAEIQPQGKMKSIVDQDGKNTDDAKKEPSVTPRQEQRQTPEIIADPAEMPYKPILFQNALLSMGLKPENRSVTRQAASSFRYEHALLVCLLFCQK